jgi:DNA-binding transcriptional LysR family regulator
MDLDEGIHMDFDKLRTFYYVVREGSVQAAERTLHISASSISRQIHKLEEQLGVLLFERTRKGLKINTSGKVLYQAASAMIDQMAIARNLLQDFKNKPVGPIACISNRSMGENLLMPGLLSRLLQHPGLELSCLWDDMAAYCFDNDIEAPALYISGLNQNAENTMIQEKISTYTLKAVAGKRYLERHGFPSTVSDLNSHQLISYNHKACAYLPERLEVNRLLTWGASTPRLPFLKVSSQQAAVTAIRGGIGIGLLPEYLIDDDMEEVFEDEPFVPWRKHYDIFAFYKEEYRGFERIHIIKNMIRSILHEQKQRNLHIIVRNFERQKLIPGHIKM